MFKKIKLPSTYSRKEKARPNLAFQNYYSCEEAFDHLKKDIQQKYKNQLDESQKPKFFCKDFKAWRVHNDTSDFNSINKTEDSNPMFKDLDDVYQMSFISSKELKKTVKNKKRGVNVKKIKKKGKNKNINLFEKFNTKTPTTKSQIFYFSTPVREEKAKFPNLNFSPILDSVNTNQSPQPPRLSDVLLQFDNLKLETPLKDNAVSVDPGTIVLQTGKKWRRSLLKLKHADTCENRGLRQGRKSCTSALIATLATINSIPTEFGPIESFSNSSVISSQFVGKKLFSNQNDLHSQPKRDSKFCSNNPFMKRNSVWQKPPQLFGIKEIDTPHKNQSSNDHKTVDVRRESTSSIVNLVDIENKLNINEKKEKIVADLKGKTPYNKSILSKERIVHFPPPNELISHSIYSNRPKLSPKNQITTKRKTYYKPDTSKDHSIHFLSRNSLMSNKDWSKLRFSNRITTKRKTYDKPDALKDQSLHFSTPHEIISGGGDSDRSKLRLNNQITSRRKTYVKPNISKDQSVHFSHPNELISDSEDSDRSIFCSSSQITTKRKIYDKPDALKDQSLYFSQPNELISGGGDSDRSTLRLNNQITSRRKTCDKPNISKDQSVHFPSPNELNSDDDISDKSIFSNNSRITDIQKFSYDKLDTSKDQSVHFPPSNELISDSEDNGRSKLRLTDQIAARRKTFGKPDTSEDQSVYFPPSNELVSDDDGSDKSIFSGSSRTTDIKKNSYYKLDTSKDQSVHFSPSNELISDSEDNDRSKLRVSDQITARRKTFGKPDTSKDQSVYFPPSNEIISDSGDSIRSKLNFCNRITARRKTFYDNSDVSKDQSDYIPSPSSNELFYDDASNRSELSISKRIPIETSPLHLSYTYYSELQTKSKENITLSSPVTGSCNSVENSELIKKNLEDVTNKSLTKSIRRSKHSEQLKEFSEAINSHTLINSHSRSLNLFSESSYFDDYDNNIRRNSEEYVARVQKDTSLKYTSPSLEETSVISTVMVSENTKSQEIGKSFASELSNTNLTLAMQNVLASRNITDRKTRSERGQEFRQRQKSPTEFEAEGSVSFVQKPQERLHFSDPILFESEEEFIEDEQIETRFSNQIEGPFKNWSSTSSSDLNDLECKNVFNHLSLNDDSFQGLQARESNLNSPNFENSDCMHELHHSTPTTDSFQGLQGSKSMLDSHSFKGWGNEPDINKLTLKEDMSFSSEVGQSKVYSCDNDEVAFRCILHRCCQNTLVNFIDAFSVAELKNSKKVGEGVYGEVFLVKRFSDPEDSVIKIIPVQGDYVVNGEVQKTYSEIISELIISQELDSLRDSDDFFTDNFCKVKKLWCLQGKYPDRLQELWNEYNKLVGSENDSPTMFSSDQQYIVLELGHGGQALADYKFSSARQAFSIFLQTSFALAVGEQCFEFEHRDLHWGNVLVMKTTDKYAMFTIESETYKFPTFGVKATIIDYTLSRMFYAGTVNFNDLSEDPDMFKGTGDYQFDIYRIMQQLLCNDWSRYVPKTNIKWLDYIVDKLLKRALYTNPKSKIHLKFIKILENLRTIMTDFESVYDYVVYLGTVYYETSGPFVIHNLG